MAILRERAAQAKAARAEFEKQATGRMTKKLPPIAVFVDDTGKRRRRRPARYLRTGGDAGGGELSSENPKEWRHAGNVELADAARAGAAADLAADDEAALELSSENPKEWRHAGNVELAKAAGGDWRLWELSADDVAALELEGMRASSPPASSRSYGDAPPALSGGAGKTSRRKRTKKSRTAGGKKSRKQRKRKTRKCSKRKRRRTCRRR